MKDNHTSAFLASGTQLSQDQQVEDELVRCFRCLPSCFRLLLRPTMNDYCQQFCISKMGTAISFLKREKMLWVPSVQKELIISILEPDMNVGSDMHTHCHMSKYACNFMPGWDAEIVIKLVGIMPVALIFHYLLHRKWVILWLVFFKQTNHAKGKLTANN